MDTILKSHNQAGQHYSNLYIHANPTLPQYQNNKLT